MLFGYPIAATEENWLHECLSEMVGVVHHSQDQGVAVPGWPDIIPEPHRAQLRRRHGLRKRLSAYIAAAGALSVAERHQVSRCLEQQNQIAELVACETDCQRLDDLPAAIREPVLNLFSFGFDLLSDTGVRDRHYATVYGAADYHVCPFCGCEYFDAPGAPREDLDHYLPRHIYPFAATNLRNLVPMGMRCNERYKEAQDILRNATGARRRSFYPYADRNLRVLLDHSVPFHGTAGQNPDWRIVFDPDSVECETWDEVFRIRERVKRDVLDPSFFRWLKDFSEWFRKRVGLNNPDDQTLIDSIQVYAEDMELMGLRARDFLRAPVFRMLHRHCQDGDARLLDLLRGVVSVAVPTVGAAVAP